MANNVIDPKKYAGYKTDKFVFVQQDKSIHDAKFETKPVSYLRGCWNRFRSNKGSIVAGVILLLLLSFAIFAPLTTSRTVEWNDANYQYVLPKSPWFEGSGFWDGTEKKKVYDAEYNRYLYYDTESKPIMELLDKGTEKNVIGEIKEWYYIKRDSYAVGAKVLTVSTEEFHKIQAWEKEHDRKVLLPFVLKTPDPALPNAIDVSTYVENYVQSLIMEGALVEASRANYTESMKNVFNDSNYFYELVAKKNAAGKALQNYIPAFGEEGKLKPLYAVDETGAYVYGHNTSTEGIEKEIRVDYNLYYEYKTGQKCYYLFGANANGFDIFVRLASGSRLSLILGVSVSLINLLIGLIWGSVSGYYGGTVDLVMERVTDILSAIPFVIVATLFQLHFAKQAGPIVSLLFAFVVTGWIGTAATTRMQFYRYKNQEYVLASRTLGARDARLIFVDILPNALGTLITSSVLMIPGVIFSESSLSYLNIIDLSNSNITSVGTLLNEGSNYLSTYPHMIAFPAIFISILMITFNLIGNGLRDAFNPTLRGEE